MYSFLLPTCTQPSRPRPRRTPRARPTSYMYLFLLPGKQRDSRASSGAVRQGPSARRRWRTRPSSGTKKIGLASGLSLPTSSQPPCALQATLPHEDVPDDAIAPADAIPSMQKGPGQLTPSPLARVRSGRWAERKRARAGVVRPELRWHARVPERTMAEQRAAGRREEASARGRRHLSAAYQARPGSAEPSRRHGMKTAPSGGWCGWCEWCDVPTLYTRTTPLQNDDRSDRALF